MSVETARRDAAVRPARNTVQHTINFQQYYDIIRDQIRQEDQLIGTRMGWLTTSQTILFGFYANGARNAAASAGSASSSKTQLAGVYGPSMLPSAHAYPIIAIVGFVMTLLIYVSIIAAVRNLHKIRRHIEGIVTYADETGLTHPVPNVTPALKGIWFGGLVAPTVVPVLFAAAWVVIAVFWLKHAS